MAECRYAECRGADYLPWPPWAVQQNRKDPICVVPLKVAKASAVVTVACCCR